MHLGSVVVVSSSLSVMQILHISEVEHRETKMMGDSPIIIVGVGTLLAL